MGERGAACFIHRVLVRQLTRPMWAILPPPSAYKLRKVSNEMGSKCQTMSHNRHKNKPKV